MSQEKQQKRDGRGVRVDGDLIEEKRKENTSLTQEGLCDAIGISITAYKKIRKGGRIRTKNFDKLLAVLNCSIVDIAPGSLLQRMEERLGGYSVLSPTLEDFKKLRDIACREFRHDIVSVDTLKAWHDNDPFTIRIIRKDSKIFVPGDRSNILGGYVILYLKPDCLTLFLKGHIPSDIGISSDHLVAKCDAVTYAETYHQSPIAYVAGAVGIGDMARGVVVNIIARHIINLPTIGITECYAHGITEQGQKILEGNGFRRVKLTFQKAPLYYLDLK